MNAYIVRFVGSHREGQGNMKKVNEFELLEPRPDDNKKPKVCLKHPRPCVYDGLTCPACQGELEWLLLTDDMKVR